MMNDDEVAPEEKEKWVLDRERDADAQNDYEKVERVIGMRDNDEGETEYYIKWKSLYYDSCNVGVCRFDQQDCAARDRPLP